MCHYCTTGNSTLQNLERPSGLFPDLLQALDHSRLDLINLGDAQQAHRSDDLVLQYCSLAPCRSFLLAVPVPATVLQAHTSAAGQCWPSDSQRLTSHGPYDPFLTISRLCPQE